MENHIIKPLLSVLFVLTTLYTHSQEFIHDTITVSTENVEVFYVLGVSTPADVLIKFPDAKITVRKSSKRSGTVYGNYVLLRLKEEKLLFRFYSSNEKDIRNHKMETKLQSVRINKGSDFCLQKVLCSSMNRSDMEVLFYEENRSDLDYSREENGLTKREYFYNSGFQVNYTGTDTRSEIKSIECFESSITQDKNQEIYYKWKAEKDKS